MKIINIAPVRNEDWCIGLTARALLLWVDEAVFLAHACTDKTVAILNEIKYEARDWEKDINGDLTGDYRERVHILIDDDPTWREMAQRQRLLDEARKLGATHVSTVDADEILSGDLLPHIRTMCERLRGGNFNGIPMRNLINGISQYRAEKSDWGERAGTCLAFGDSPRIGWQARNGYDHHQRSPIGSMMQEMVPRNYGGLLHLQFANRRRLIAKHAAYKAMERTKYPQKPVDEIERTYSAAPSENGILAADCPDNWLAPYLHWLKHLHLDAEPWQEAETRRLVAAQGAEYFAGLDLFGVA